MLVSRNLSTIDRTLRGVIGVSIFIFTLFFSNYIEDSIVWWLLFIFSVLNLVSLLTAWCPIYHLANLSTYKAKDE
ncbi:YgaP family membrane protein [Marinomonas phaeophyticola]|uniref:YgaP family membrane protein n=1 Tax=Marinomonas phaeophyticola TaxID=3004091 RepID=UPI003D182828